MATSLFHICLITVVASLFIPIHSEKHVALFIFGDSLFDVGANNYINTNESFRTNFFPYGETFFRYPTGRASDGRVIPDFVATFAGLPLLPTYLFPGHNDIFGHGVSFASYGAGALMETRQGFVVPLKVQLKQFEKVTKMLKQKLGEAEAKELISNAVYLFSIGGNDYFFSISSGSTILSSPASRDGFINQVMGNITDVLQGIYKEGGRKFGFFTMPPLGCIPGARNATGPCIDPLNELSMLHGKILSKVLKNMQNHLDEFKYSIFDLYKSFMEIIEHPSKYGFKEVKTACCGSGPYRGENSCGRTGVKYELCSNPEDYLFFDLGHPSEHAAKLFALLAWNGPSDITAPYDLKTLFQLKKF